MIRPGATEPSLQVGRARRDEVRRATLLRVRVGPHDLVLDLRTILAIESSAERVEHEAIRGPICLRKRFGVSGAPAPESVLVPSVDAVYRLEVCRIGQLVQSELRAVHRVPRALRALLEPLAVRGLVALPALDDTVRAGAALVAPAAVAAGAQEASVAARDGARIAFLVDPVELAARAWSERA